MNILYVNTLNYGVSYWRLDAYATELKLYHRDKCGVYLEWFFDPRENIAWDKICLMDNEYGEAIRDKLDAAFKFYNVIIIQKIQNKEGLQLLKELKEKYPKVLLVAELDDSIGEITPSNIFIDKLKSEHSIAAEHAIISDAIICSTEYLANSIRKMVGDKPIHVAPNCISWDMWKVRKHKKPVHRIPKVGYVAAGGHDEDLLIAYNALKPMIKKREVDFIVRYGGWRPEWLKNVDFKIASWGMHEYAQKIYDLDLDLAIAPLRDTEFNRCKSNLKWIEWSSLGVKLLASNVEPYKKTKGKIFLTGNTKEEWQEAIRNAINTNVSEKHLKNDNKLNYNLSKECEHLLEFLKKVML